MLELKTFFLFLATAIAEIFGCYLPYLWIKQGHSAWLLVPAAASLAFLPGCLPFTLQPRAEHTPRMGAFIFSRLCCGSGRSMASDLLHGMWPGLWWLSRGWPSLCLRRDRPRYRQSWGLAV